MCLPHPPASGLKNPFPMTRAMSGVTEPGAVPNTWPTPRRSLPRLAESTPPDARGMILRRSAMDTRGQNS